jgi:undecaprenyl pyrophosphate phosphatase UppP
MFEFTAQSIQLAVQSITECLPISSSAHVLILNHFFHLSKHNIVYEVLFNFVPLCAFVCIFWRDFWRLFNTFLRSTQWFTANVAHFVILVLGLLIRWAAVNAFRVISFWDFSDEKTEKRNQDAASARKRRLLGWMFGIGFPRNRRLREILLKNGVYSTLRNHLSRGSTPLETGSEELRDNSNEMLALLRNIIIAVVPVILVSVELELHHISLPNGKMMIALNSILFGALLFFADRTEQKTELKKLSARTAFIIGIVQILARLSGVSRMGLCITMARFYGLNRTDSLRFACLTGAPILLCGGAGPLVKAVCIDGNTLIDCGGIEWWLVAFVCVASIAVLRLFVWSLARYSFQAIAIYRILLGGLLALL